MRYAVVSIPGGRLYDTGYKIWSHGLINVSITEVNMLKNSSTLAVSVQINLSIKLGFSSVNGPRETYFVDQLRISIASGQRRLFWVRRGRVYVCSASGC